MNFIKDFAHIVILLFFTAKMFIIDCYASELSNLGLHVIPYPQQVEVGGNDFKLNSSLTIELDVNSTDVDRQTAEKLKKELGETWGIVATLGEGNGGSTVILSKQADIKTIGDQGYQLTTDHDVLTITANDEDGLFYGIQTFFQLIKKSRGRIFVPGMKITDWPDVKIRAVHYDTKHHQDKASYVKDFIKDLARYKINMLVWEWEDKFAYQSHPEIGAPGAFTMAEMQEFTRLGNTT